MKTFNEFLREEDGMETINVAILLAIGLSLVIAFKGKIQDLWDSITDGLNPVDVKIKEQ